MIKTLGGRRLGRTGSHRRAMLRNMATSLFLHEKVESTVANCKELRPFAEKLITDAKKGKHREVRRDVQNKDVFKKLFDILVPRFQNRPGGYTQILRTRTRQGDNAELGMVRLIG